MKLNLRGIDLNLLTIFDSLMDTGKLSATAADLGMSQPAVSAALQRLRLTFGDELFIRHRSGMQPTPRAHLLHTDIREALHLVRRAVSTEPMFNPATADRSFTLLSDVFFESTVIGELLNRLSDIAPGVRIDTSPLAPEDPASTLTNLKGDLILDYATHSSTQLCSAQVSVERLVVIAARAHPRIQSAPTLEEFLSEAHVILSRRHGKLTSLEYALGNISLNRRIRATLQSYSSMPIVVANTDCLATVPQRLGTLYEQAFDVRCYPFPVAMEPVPVYMYWPRVLDQDPAHRWFRQQLSAVLASGEGVSG